MDGKAEKKLYSVKSISCKKLTRLDGPAGERVVPRPLLRAFDDGRSVFGREGVAAVAFEQHPIARTARFVDIIHAAVVYGNWWAVLKYL